ncbi:MAG: hypothetical protein MUD09_07980, partial [Desulfobacterales bacterium]|nr:hypothetical protein [Desulfobacterales bacterium]
MKNFGPDFVEFSVYDSMVNGEMRPFLDEYSSDKNVKKLLNKYTPFKTLKFGRGRNRYKKFIEDFNDFMSTVPGKKAGDIYNIVFFKDPDDRIIRIMPAEPKEINSLIDIDIPPAPDYKSEVFCEIIEFEFQWIKERAQIALKSFKNEELLSLFANRGLQIAKRIAVDAHKVSKQVKPPDRDTWNDPNSYIFYLLKLFLLRSIIFYQGLFEPYIKSKIYNKDQLRVFLFQEKPAH